MPEDSKKNTEIEFASLVIESSGLAGALAKTWLYLYKRNTILTTIGTVLLAGGIAVGVHHDLTTRRAKEEQARIENLSLNNQLTQLEKTEESLESLITFVQDQKIRLKESEALVEGLQSEKEQLEPLVQADRKTVDAIFAAQEQRRSRTVWKERGIGFAIGVVASLAAAVIWAVASAFWKQQRTRRSRAEQPTAPNT